MALEVWTARISTRDPDALNITRQSGDPVFAPSWALLSPMIRLRREGIRLSDDEWKEQYARRYLREMRLSQKHHPRAWEGLLRRDRVVLVCYCVGPKRCHRTLLGKLLGTMRATFRGELDEGATEREGFDLAERLDQDC